jgi:hypothetical protein
VSKWTFQCGAPSSVCTDCGCDCEGEAVFVKGTDHLCCACARAGMNVYCETINEQTKEAAKLTAERDKVVGLLKNFRDGYDCDSDAHKYGTECRCCAAAKMLDELLNKGTE